MSIINMHVRNELPVVPKNISLTKHVKVRSAKVLPLMQIKVGSHYTYPAKVAQAVRNQVYMWNRNIGVHVAQALSCISLPDGKLFVRKDGVA